MHLGLQLYLTSTCLYGLNRKPTLEGFLLGPVIFAQDVTSSIKECVIKYHVYDYIKSGVAWFYRNRWNIIITYFVATGIRSASRNHNSPINCGYLLRDGSMNFDRISRILMRQMMEDAHMIMVGWYLEPHFWVCGRF